MTNGEWATVGVGIASFFLALVVLLTSFIFRREFGLAQKTRNIRDIIGRDYLDRELSEPFEANGKPFHNLKDVRSEVHNEIDELGYDGFRKLTINKNNWENKFTHILGLELQRIGVMALAGVIPTSVVLPMHGYSIVEDWGYCSLQIREKVRHVDEADKEKPIMQIPTPIGKVYFHRRHAEWLAYAAAIYMYQHSSYKELEALLRPFYYEFIKEKEIDISDELYKTT